MGDNCSKDAKIEWQCKIGSGTFINWNNNKYKSNR